MSNTTHGRVGISLSLGFLFIATNSNIGLAKDLAGSLIKPGQGLESAGLANGLDRLREDFDRVKSAPSLEPLLKETENHALSVDQRSSSMGVETTKFQHYYKGVEVIGSMAVHHRGKNGVEVDDAVARFDLDTQPALKAEDAVGVAQSVAGDRGLYGKPELKILPSSSDLSAHLVYWVKMKPTLNDAGREVIVDAHTGKVLGNLSVELPLTAVHVFTAAEGVLEVDPKTLPRNPRELDPEMRRKIEQSCQVIHVKSGSPLAIVPQNCKPVVVDGKTSELADDSSKRALSNSDTVLQYFRNRHNRESFDGRGSDLVSFVHVGKGYNNASWNMLENYMSYGDGDGKFFNDFTVAVDVAGHEMAHGVTSKTARLISMGESGALNEAFSDFFGKMIENRDNWVIGKDLMLSATRRKGIRDLQNPSSMEVSIPSGVPGVPPTRVAYPDHLSKKIPEPTDAPCDENNDRCWVHLNATIPGHTFYLATQAIGKEKAEKLFYLVLTQRLTARSGFKQFATATHGACAQVFESDTCARIKTVFEKVGL